VVQPVAFFTVRQSLTFKFLRIGQNPTSGTLSVQRRKDIYLICCKYDVMIIEDDPYWYLQFPSAAESEALSRNLPYEPTPMHTPEPMSKSSGFPFLDSLVPSYLSVDTEGRVIRLDTVSICFFKSLLFKFGKTITIFTSYIRIVHPNNS
jgi:DNA-binding transcriptional MocR family regulator